MAGEVLLDKHAGVATVTLNRPAQRNALTPAMADEMVAALREIEADAAIGAAVIRGAGGHFCAGADLGEAARMFADPLESQVHDGTTRIYEAFVRAGHLPVPVVAAVRGAAVGAGMNLLLATDLRVVSREARLLSGFLRLGVHPGGGHMLLLAEAAGPQAAAAMAIFGEEIDGATAQALGLAWAALPDEEVEPHAQALAARAARDPELARAAVHTLRMTASAKATDWARALQAERAAQLWSMRRAGLRQGKPRIPREG
jgi:enoyl-CoA hydratase